MDTVTKETTRNSDLNIIDHRLYPLYYTVGYSRGQAGYYLYVKRAFDVMASLILILCVLSWLYPLLALIINMSSKGGTLFIQKRVGLNGQVFRCLKFRTMVINDKSDLVGAAWNDKRITRIGRILRATYIDELPQLINVLKGEMSIVGPRPHMLYHHQRFSAELPQYNYRHWMKPGITGLAQVKGYHGGLRDKYDIYGRTRLDLFYVQRSSFGLDMMILLKTVSVVLSFNKNIQR
ncbi:MAG: sugar transferase [Flavipsychrobacter sp.]|nr:sugar transferase [Flavipsychrobacter sp.]